MNVLFFLSLTASFLFLFSSCSLTFCSNSLCPDVGTDFSATCLSFRASTSGLGGTVKGLKMFVSDSTADTSFKRVSPLKRKQCFAQFSKRNERIKRIKYWKHHLKHYQQQKDDAGGRARTTVSVDLWSTNLLGNSVEKIFNKYKNKNKNISFLG